MDNNTYIHILTDTLIKKDALLDKLLTITALQEECLNEQFTDIESFEKKLSDKEELIQQLIQLDDGFERIYSHIKEEIGAKRLEYREQIARLQELIRQITDKSTRLQGIEISNKNKIETYFLGKKKEIKNLKISNRTASNYYKNMYNQQIGESYFLDKKK